MTGKERIIAALEFRDFDAVPIQIHDCAGVPFEYPGWYEGEGRYKGGSYYDGWSCRWDALEPDVCGEVKFHPLGDDWKGFDSFRPPYHILEKADLSRIEKACEAQKDKFVLVAWEPPMPNMFERMQHLRGTENLFLDFAYGDSRMFKLRDMLHEYYMKQMEMWCKTPIDCVHIADDWGSQISLLISPEMWREYFKGIYRDYCDMAKQYNKYIIFHSDGYIMDIIPDMIEIGVNAVNSQLFCLPIEELAKKYHHKICFWGEIDRQHIQVFGTPDEMRAAVRRVANAFLPYGKTGFVAQCVYTLKVPEANKKAEQDEWAKISAEIA